MTIWTDYVKQFAKDNNMTYGCALSDPSCSSGYRNKQPPKRKKLSQSVERELMGFEEDDTKKYNKQLKHKKKVENLKSILDKKVLDKEVSFMAKEDINRFVPVQDLAGNFINISAKKKRGRRKKGEENITMTIKEVKKRGRPKKYSTAEEARKAKIANTIASAKKRKEAKGKGIINTIYNLGNPDTIKKVIQGRNDFSPKVYKIINQFSNKVITGITLHRTPLNKSIMTALQVASGNTFSQKLSNTPYEKLFHLFMCIDFAGKSFVLEKNEVINAENSCKLPSVTESKTITNIPSGLTLKQALDNTQKRMGNNFFTYSAKNNNCQDFIVSFLTANNIGSSNDIVWVKQDTKTLFEGNDRLRKITNTITDIGARIDVIKQGGMIIEEEPIIQDFIFNGVPGQLNMNNAEDFANSFLGWYLNTGGEEVDRYTELMNMNNIIIDDDEEDPPTLPVYLTNIQNNMFNEFLDNWEQIRDTFENGNPQDRDNIILGMMDIMDETIQEGEERIQDINDDLIPNPNMNYIEEDDTNIGGGIKLGGMVEEEENQINSLNQQIIVLEQQIIVLEQQLKEKKQQLSEKKQQRLKQVKKGSRGTKAQQREASEKKRQELKRKLEVDNQYLNRQEKSKLNQQLYTIEREYNPVRKEKKKIYSIVGRLVRAEKKRRRDENLPDMSKEEEKQFRSDKRNMLKEERLLEINPFANDDTNADVIDINDDDYDDNDLELLDYYNEGSGIINFEDMKWGSFSKQLEVYNRQHKKKLDLHKFAMMILANPKKYQKRTLKRARFYINVIMKKGGNLPCWKNYEQIGMKNKNGKQVPNCIPKKKSSNNNILMPNNWINHVKNFAKKHSIKYNEALKHPDCKTSYKKGMGIPTQDDELVAIKYDQRNLGANGKVNLN